VAVPDEVGDRLYREPPERFVAARDEAVAAAKAAGDSQTAAAIGKLRRPTLAAWLVNLLALSRPELIEELVDLAEALRRAQAQRQGDQIRQLSGRRRELLDGLTAEAGRLAVEAGRPAGDALPLEEVTATLSAALADEQAARQVREGRLQRPLSYAGFGFGDAFAAAPARTAPGAPARTSPTAPAKTAPAKGAPGKQVPAKTAPGKQAPAAAAPGKAGGAKEAPDEAVPDRKAEAARERAAERERARELAAARTRWKQAQAVLDQAAAAEHDAVAALDKLTTTLRELREQLSGAQTDLQQARQRRKTADRDAQAARRLYVAAGGELGSAGGVGGAGDQEER
jgi:DNA repair exonuclease SbcCD ATPase subunit